MTDSFGFQWHITDRCNGRCRHCYQDRFDAGREPELDTLTGLADHILSHLKIPVSINVTGGEPLLFPGIFDFLAHLGSFSHVEEINLITNATVVSGDLIRSLSRLPRLTEIKVSLESHDPSVNDAVRGPGHFETVTRNLPVLRTAGVPLILMVTLGTHNASSISGVIRLARELGLSGIIFERYVPLGQGLGFSSHVMPAVQWQAVSLQICREAGMEVTADDLLPYKAFRVSTGPDTDPEAEKVSGALCNLGPSSMALMPDGTVFPCRRLPVNVGRLPDQSIEEIRSRLSRFLPDNLSALMRGQRCGRCGVDECIGCRALTLACGGDLLGDDPQCPLDPG